MSSRELIALFAAFLFLFIPLFPALANPSSEKKLSVEKLLSMPLEELVELDISLATGTPKPVRLAPAIASVITALDIERMGAATLDEVLETIPGLHVTPSNFNRLNSNYSIRGIHTKQNPEVLLLLDGVQITNFHHGNRPDTFNLSVANISRIEVIRGPGSAVHGADAFAGTINVITKTGPEFDGISAGTRAGSFGAIDTWLQHGTDVQGWDVALSLDYLGSDGDTDRIIESDLASVIAANASMAPGPLETDDRIIDLHLGLAKDNWTFRFWTWQQMDGGNGAGISQALDPTGHEKQEVFLTNIIYQNSEFARDWDLNLSLSHVRHLVDSYIVLVGDGAVLPIGADGNIDFNPLTWVGFTTFPDGVIGNPRAVNDTYSIDVNTTFDGRDHHLLRFGCGLKYLNSEASETKNFGPGVLDGAQFKTVSGGALTDVTGTPNIFMRDTSRYIWNILVQDEWSLAEHWEMTAGVRYDRYSDFGGTTNPRLALVWEARSHLAAKLLYGRAFRAPTFSESYYVNNPASLGNPNLRPETIDTLELAFDYHPTNRLRTQLNLFTYEIDDLIENVKDTGQATTTAQNAKNQEGRGVEIEAEWRIIDTLHLRSNLAYQRSRDARTNEIVPDAPEMQFFANVYWEFQSNWSLDSQYYWIAKRHRTNGDPRQDIKDNNIINLTLRRKNIAKRWDVAVAVRNVFNEDVREPSAYNQDLAAGSAIPNDYPMEGRNVWAEVRVHF